MLVLRGDKLDSFIKALKEDFLFFDLRDDFGGGIPFKEIFFPASEETFSSKKLQGKLEFHVKTEKTALFGLSEADLDALNQLDQIMEKPHKDFFYFQKRENSLVIGITEEDSEAIASGDIILEKIKEGDFKISARSEKGESAVKKYKKLFTEVKTLDVKTRDTERQKNGWQEEMREMLRDPELLGKAVEWSHGNPIWDELAGTCLGCGVCTYVCPLCYCFSNEDRIALDGKCSRCRQWDACTLPGFAKVAGNFNFRNNLKERYYNWFYHKFVRGYNEFGRSLCVGCERCKKQCPAGIDIKEVLSRIVEEYKNSQNG